MSEIIFCIYFDRSYFTKCFAICFLFMPYWNSNLHACWVISCLHQQGSYQQWEDLDDYEIRIFWSFCSTVSTAVIPDIKYKLCVLQTLLRKPYCRGSNIMCNILYTHLHCHHLCLVRTWSSVGVCSMIRSKRLSM